MPVPTTPGSRLGAMPWSYPSASASSCATASRSNDSRCRRRRCCTSTRPPHACARKTSTSAWRRLRKVRRQPAIRGRPPQPRRADPDPLMSIATGAQRAKSGSDGFIIVAVLWILAALATLVSIYAIYVTNSAIAVASSGGGTMADPLVSAGVELAAYQLLGQTDDKRPAIGQFTARIGAAQLTIVFQTEATRIDLNQASKELLAKLLVGFGASPLDAGDYAERIIAWRTQAAVQNIDSDPENARYQSAGLSYTPRHAPFIHVSELWLVQGVPPVLIERMLPFVTVLSRKAQGEIIDAAPQAIAALPGMTPEIVNAIVAARDAGTLDRKSLPDLLAGVGQGAAAADAGKAFRVGVRVAFDNGRRSAAEAVIVLPDDGPVPYRVLSWRNAFDGTTDQPLDFGRR